MRRPPRGLILTIVVYIAVRAVVLHLAFDQVAMTNYELYPMGTLPKALLIGWNIPPQVYYDNAAGQLVTGVLAVPLYALFGDGWISLKLVPALCGLGALICVWTLLDQHASRVAANLAALAFALGPSELVLKYSLMASGNHFENLFFVSLALFCFFRLHSVPEERRGRALALAGASSGLALFVFLGAIIPVGLMFGLHLGLRGWRGTARDLRLGAPAFLVGISPLLALNLFSGGRGADFLAAKFGGGGGGRDWGLVSERMVDFVTVELPRSGFHHPFGSEGVGWPNWALLAALGAAWLVLLPGVIVTTVKLARSVFGGTPPAVRDVLAVPLVLFPPLATLAFGLSDLRIDSTWPQRLGVAGYRYFLPVFLFGTMLAAMVAARGWRRGGAARVAGTVLAVALLAPAAWNGAWIKRGTTGVGEHYSGWNFMQAARGLFNPSVGLTHDERMELAADLPQPYQGDLYRGIGFVEIQRWTVITSRKKGKAGWKLISTEPLPISAILEPYPESARSSLAHGIGTGLRTYIGDRQHRDALHLALKRVHASGEPWASDVVAGAAQIKDTPCVWSEVPARLNRSLQLLETLPEELREDYGRGLGEVCGRLFAREIPAEERWLKGSFVAATTWGETRCSWG